jgi:hypothetical protein
MAARKSGPLIADRVFLPGLSFSHRSPRNVGEEKGQINVQFDSMFLLHREPPVVVENKNGTDR